MSPTTTGGRLIKVLINNIKNPFPLKFVKTREHAIIKDIKVAIITAPNDTDNDNNTIEK